MMAVVLAASNGARADNCGQSLAQPKINIRTEMAPVTYDDSQSIQAITSNPLLAISRDAGAFPHAIGATQVMTSNQWQLDMEGIPRSEGGICWSAKAIELTVRAITKVYVAREIPRDTCVWREVMQHEQKHVALDRQLFPQFAAIVRPRILETLARTVSAATGEEAKAIFESRITTAINSAVDQFSVGRNARQLAIDTAEEYGRFNQVCGEAELREIFSRAGII